MMLLASLVAEIPVGARQSVHTIMSACPFLSSQGTNRPLFRPSSECQGCLAKEEVDHHSSRGEERATEIHEME